MDFNVTGPRAARFFNRATLGFGFHVLCLLLLQVSSVGLSYAGDTAPGYERWKALLHYSGDKSLVEGEDFFLSRLGNADYRLEAVKEAELLKGPMGREFACEFPVRYEWLKENAFEIPTFNLDECVGLSRFESQFDLSNVSLVLASESLDAPVSAFGHLFLLFSENSTPSGFNDVIHFAAETGRNSALKYVWYGLTGKFHGYYLRAPYFRIAKAYTECEQRKLTIFSLNLDDSQKMRLVRHLYELNKSVFRYYYLKENCAYSIAALLAVAYGEGMQSFDSEIYVTPKMVVSYFSKNITGAYEVEPSLVNANCLIKDLNEEEYGRLNEAENDENFNDFKALGQSEREVLGIRGSYDFSRRGVYRDNYNRNMLESRFTDCKFEPVTIEDEDKSRDRFSLGLGVTDGKRFALLGYKYYGYDYSIMEDSALDESELKILGIDLRLTQNEVFDVERIDLLEVSSYYRRNDPELNPAWSFRLGADRLNRTDGLLGAISAGIGLGGAVFGGAGGAGFLAIFGIEADDSIANAYSGVRLYGYANLNGKYRMGSELLMKFGTEFKYNMFKIVASRRFIGYSVESALSVDGEGNFAAKLNWLF